MKTKQKSLEDKVQEDKYRFIVKPLIIVFGIYIVSMVLDIMLKLDNETFRYLFTGIGGIPFLIYYYKKELKK